MLLVSYLRNHSQIHCHEDPPLWFFSESCGFRSYVLVFNPFWVNFCIWCKVRVQLHSFACRYLLFLAFVEKTVVSLFNILVILLKIIWPYMWEFISGFPVSLVFFLSLCRYTVFDYYSFILSFEVRIYGTSSLYFLFQDCFCYSTSFEVPYEFQDGLFHSHQKCHLDFDRNCVES